MLSVWLACPVLRAIAACRIQEVQASQGTSKNDRGCSHADEAALHRSLMSKDGAASYQSGCHCVMQLQSKPLLCILMEPRV
jgi:hypothetical protein